MDKHPRADRRLECLLKETLFEISQGKKDPFHTVVADVLEEITAPGEKNEGDQENPKNDPG